MAEEPFQLIIKLSEYVKLILKHWDPIADAKNPSDKLFMKVAEELNLEGNEANIKVLRSAWNNQNSGITKNVSVGLTMKLDVSVQTKTEMDRDWIEEHSLYQIIDDGEVSKHLLSNSLIPCLEYYQRRGCVVAKFGDVLMTGEDYLSLTTKFPTLGSLHAVLAAILNVNVVNSLLIGPSEAACILSGLIKPPDNLDSYQYVVMPYEDTNWCMVVANNWSKSAHILVSKISQKHNPLHTLFPGRCKAWKLFTYESVNNTTAPLTLINFLSYTVSVNSQTVYNPSMIMAMVLKASDSMRKICQVCGKEVTFDSGLAYDPARSTEPCVICLRVSHSSCLPLEYSTVCMLCSQFVDMHNKENM